MAFQFTLEKVMGVKEREKLEVESEWSEATQRFEKIASKLYKLLKQKEEFEMNSRLKMESGIAVHDIQHNQSILMHLQRDIEQCQLETQRARERMQHKQSALLDKTIELKKYEKMKQVKHDQYIDEMKVQEQQLMDELAVQLYTKR